MAAQLQWRCLLRISRASDHPEREAERKVDGGADQPPGKLLQRASGIDPRFGGFVR